MENRYFCVPVSLHPRCRPLILISLATPLLYINEQLKILDCMVFPKSMFYIILKDNTNRGWTLIFSTSGIERASRLTTAKDERVDSLHVGPAIKFIG